MMKVAHILSYYPGQEGLTSFCRGLGKAFQNQSGIEVPIITFRSKPVRNPGQDEDSLVLKFPHHQRHPFDLPRDFLAALDEGRLTLDGAVLHGTYSPQVFALARALHRRGIAYIFMPHDPYVASLRRHHAVRKFVYWHLCEKWVIKNAKAIQLLADEHEAPLRELGCNTPVFTLANGCDPSTIQNLDLERRIPGKGDDFVIQYLGRMDRNHKGLDLLIRGYAQFVQELGDQANVKLILSGNDWEDREFLEALATELNLGERIEFTGRLSESSVEVHSRADLSVLCSRFDGFGLTIVEAMLARRPVLVSCEAGISGFVRDADAGFVVKPDVLAIARGLRSAWEKREVLDDMGKRGQKIVLNDLTWESVALRSHEIYKKVFAEQSAH